MAEIVLLPGAREHRSCGHKSQVYKRQGPKAGRRWVFRCRGVRLMGAERLTRSFPLAMASESGEWPLHSTFGFALWDRRSRTMSLAHCGKKREERQKHMTSEAPPPGAWTCCQGHNWPFQNQANHSIVCSLHHHHLSRERLQTETWGWGVGVERQRSFSQIPNIHLQEENRKGTSE